MAFSAGRIAMAPRAFVVENEDRNRAAADSEGQNLVLHCLFRAFGAGARPAFARSPAAARVRHNPLPECVILAIEESLDLVGRIAVGAFGPRQIAYPNHRGPARRSRDDGASTHIRGTQRPLRKACPTVSE